MAEQVAQLSEEQWNTIKAALDGEITALRIENLRLEDELAEIRRLRNISHDERVQLRAAINRQNGLAWEMAFLANNYRQRAEAAEALVLRIHKVCKHTLEGDRSSDWYKMVVSDIGQLTRPTEAQAKEEKGD